MNTVLTVTQINTYIKSLIDYDDNLKNIYVSGEISNFTNHYRTGHFYFTLKDEKSAIKAVMFNQYAGMIRFEPYNGLKVIIRARLSVFERDGVYQLYVTDMQPDGLGQLNLAYEQLKSRLEEEGLFDPIYKKPIPSMPKNIAVITSPTGAAIQDIINVISRRYSCCNLITVPVQVQGENSAKQIVRAIKEVNRQHCADVIILGRGGGSIEDLWSFNEEIVARAIFASKIPIISAVGHETDFTISDFVADLRAPTPSAAAELATPNLMTVYNEINRYNTLMKECLTSKLLSYKVEVDRLNSLLKQNSPDKELKAKAEKVERLTVQLNRNMLDIYTNKSDKLRYVSGKLDALSPLKTLSRGYCLAFNDDGKHIDTVEKINETDNIKLKFKDGEINCLVNEVRK